MDDRKDAPADGAHLALGAFYTLVVGAMFHSLSMSSAQLGEFCGFTWWLLDGYLLVTWWLLTGYLLVT